MTTGECRLQPLLPHPPHPCPLASVAWWKEMDEDLWGEGAVGPWGAM